MSNTAHTRNRMSVLLRAATACMTISLAGCPVIPPTGNENGNDNASSRVFTKAAPGCLECHGNIEDIHATEVIDCTDCHGGDFSTDKMEQAHVQPTLPIIMDKTTAPLDYDLPYQKFVNPSNLRVVRDTCGVCHEPHIDWVLKSLMATGAGHYAGGLYQNGVSDSKTPVYGNFAVRDEDGEVPTEAGAVAELIDLIEYDPSLDQSEFATHYRAVPGQVCARCHLWSRGKGYRGAEGADGTYRADGCAACHMIYANDGRSTSADASIDHNEQGHPLVHGITRKIPKQQCIHCHHRGARIGLSFTGRSQMPPQLPSGPGVAGTTDVKFNGNYHYADSVTNPEDIHGERGVECIDCHTQAGVMGDGNIYGHMDQATKIECRTCHGTPTEGGQFIDRDGKALTHIERREDGEVVLTSKVTGVAHPLPQLKDIINPESISFNAKAAAAMNDHHLKDEGGLECYACHASWTPNCFGCHFTRDEQQMGTNLITRNEEVGKASTNNKVFVSLKHFSMGMNAQGKMSPYIVGCQPIADVTDTEGNTKLDFVMPETVNGVSGLALNPVNPHTNRGRGEVRTCAECHRSPPSLGLGSGNYSVARDYAYATAADGVRVFDRNTDPTNPTLVKTLTAGAPVALATFPNVISGAADYLYVASGSSGLSIFDMTAGIPDGPAATLADIDAIDVSRAARYLYVVVEGVGVNIYDNQNPTAATEVGAVSIPTALRAVPWGIHLFVAAGEAGLVIVDISDHTAPRIVGELADINAADVTLYAHQQAGSDFAARAYVADPDFGVRVVDLLPDFSAPTLAGGVELPGAVGLDTYTRWLAAEGDTPSREHDYLYVAAGSAGMHVLDITAPDDIKEISAMTDLDGGVLDVNVASHMTPPGVDDYALVAGAAGVHVIRVSDPRQPALVRTIPASGASRVFVDVQQLDRFLDEQGNVLKENSHPGAGTLSRTDIVRILGVDIGS